jgi:cytochrome c oxidase cbb3-type subunit 2
MNYGPIVFLAAFFALVSSWYGFVVKPQFQLGHMMPTNTVPGGVTYPTARPGLAQQGLQVYRANGCYQCHSQQVMQDGAFFEVILRDAGTNLPSMEAAVRHLAPKLAEQPNALENLPKPVLRNVSKEEADRAIKLLNASGGKAAPWVVAAGPDIERGWGKRRSVAEDFLYDSPVMAGGQRIGPDLANVGLRQPDINWHLRHFYAPAAVVKGSVMPPYKFFFEKRKIGRRPNPGALQGAQELGIEPGYELIPKQDAIALAAYMLSLRADAPLYSAPYSVASAPPAQAAQQTNAAPAQGATQPEAAKP